MSSDMESTGDYWLRKKNTVMLLPATKAAAQLNSSHSCKPPKVSKKSMCLHRISSGPNPLGKKGNISNKYDSKSSAEYIKQMFKEEYKLGKGSYGMVHAYTSTEDGQCYAIKKSSKHNKLREVENMDIIDGAPNCVQYFNAWVENNVAYIQMELGTMSLAEYAEKNHHISEQECWNILHDVVIALKYIHALGYCHMDIKPENIIITSDGKYKLADFGLLMNYQAGMCKKTLPSDGDGKYISSEALQGDFGPAGDIFALGISILEVAGDIALPESGIAWHSLRSGAFITIACTEEHTISPDLEAVINWMISRSPQKRPSADRLLRIPNFKKLTKSRFNHFERWRQS